MTDMTQAVLLMLVVFAVAALIWWRSRSKHLPTPSATEADPGKYRCVEVHSGQGACDAVKGLETIRFLSAEAPRLPVSGCNARKCGCTYGHYSDRRHDHRRHPYDRLRSVAAAVGGDRRLRPDRRHSPHIAFEPSIEA